MTRLTDLEGKAVWVNEQHIISIGTVPNEGIVEIYFINGATAYVKGIPDEVAGLIWDVQMQLAKLARKKDITDFVGP